MSAQEDNIEILSTIAFGKLKTQISSIDGLDNKIGVMFGLTNGLLIGLLGFVGFIEKPIQCTIIYLIYTSFVTYLLSMVLLVYSYLIRRWNFRPNLSALKGICTDEQYNGFPQIIRGWVAEQCMEAYDYNNIRIVQKRRLTFRALAFVLVQTILLIVIATMVALG